LGNNNENEKVSNSKNTTQRLYNTENEKNSTTLSFHGNKLGKSGTNFHQNLNLNLNKLKFEKCKLK